MGSKIKWFMGKKLKCYICNNPVIVFKTGKDSTLIAERDPKGGKTGRYYHAYCREK